MKAQGVTITELFAKSNGKVINDIVKEQVRLIDSSILLAHSSGLNQISYTLPTNFVINNMDKSDTQVLVYSELLKIYTTPEPQGKGFKDVKISIGNTSVLYIRWVNGLDNYERTDRKNLIKKFMIN